MCNLAFIHALNTQRTPSLVCHASFRHWTIISPTHKPAGDFFFLPVLLFLSLSLHILNGSFTGWILICVSILFWHQSFEFFSVCTSCFRISACYCPLKCLQTISFSQEFMPVDKDSLSFGWHGCWLPKALPLLEQCHQYLQLPSVRSALPDWPQCCLHKIKCYL